MTYHGFDEGFAMCPLDLSIGCTPVYTGFSLVVNHFSFTSPRWHWNLQSPEVVAQTKSILF